MNAQKRKHTHKHQWIGLLFVSPFLIGLLTYFAVVILSSVEFSFQEINIGSSGYAGTFIGWKNYVYALGVDSTFNQLLVNSLVEMLVNTPLVLFFSLFVAVILNQKMPGRTAFRAIFFIPVIISTGLVASADSNNVVLSMLSSSSAISTGVVSGSGALSAEAIETYIASLNFSPTLVGYVADSVNNILGVINQSGVQIVIFLAGLQSISPSIYEYAKTEGATGWETFWKLTLPLIMPIFFVNLFYTIINNVTSNTNRVMSYINRVGFSNALFGESAAMSWIYFVAIAVLITLGALIVRGVIVRNSRTI